MFKWTISVGYRNTYSCDSGHQASYIAEWLLKHKDADNDNEITLKVTNEPDPEQDEYLEDEDERESEYLGVEEEGHDLCYD